MLLLFIILVAAAWLRFSHFANHALWIDEIINLERALLPLHDIIVSLHGQGPDTITPDYCPPLYHLLLHFFLGLGRTDLAAKLPGILCGLGTIVLAYRLTQNFFSARAAGIVAVLISLSSFMVYYSRDVRPFSLFLLLSLCALYCFRKTIENGRSLSWAAYALLSAASLYTLYLYPMNLAGLALYLLGTTTYDRVRLGQPLPWKTWRAFLVATLAAVALYAPWIPAHLFLLRLSNILYPPGPASSTPLTYLFSVFRDFVLYGGENRAYLALSLFLLVLGCARAWRMGRGREVLLLLCWGAAPIPVYCLMDSSHPFYSRHVIALYFCVTIGIGLGLDALIALVAKNRQGLIPVIVGVVLAVFYSLPNMARLETFFETATSIYKDQALQLYLDKGRCAYFDSCRPASISFITRWYLPHVFEPLGTATDQRYRRLLYVATESTLAVAPGYASHAVEKFLTTYNHRIGLANTSPVILRPRDGGGYGFRENLHDFSLYRHARQWENLGINRDAGLVGGDDPTRPASLTYAFDLSEFPDADDVRLVLSFVYKKHVLAASDDRWRVEFARDNGPYEPLVTIGGKDFRDPPLPQGAQYLRHALTQDFILPRERLRGASTVSVRCVFTQGMTLGAIRLSGLAFTVSGSPAPGTPDPADRLLANLRRNTRVAPLAEAEALMPDPAVTVFALSGEAARKNGVEGLAARDAFLRAHPGTKPVLEVADAAGTSRYVVYDPFLDADGLRLSESGETALGHGDPSVTAFRSVTARGTLRHPLTSVDGIPLPLDVWPPKGSLVQATAGAPTTVFYRADFQAAGFDPGQFFLEEGTRQNGEEPCLRCEDGRDCWFAYLVDAAAPLSEVRLTYFPRLFQDSAGKNRITVQCSEDFKTFRDLDVFTGDSSGTWTAQGRQRTVRVPLPAAARRVWLRFLLSSEACQVWGSPEYPTSLLAILAAKPFAGVDTGVPGILRAAFAAHNDFTLRLNARTESFPAFLLRLP